MRSGHSTHCNIDFKQVVHNRYAYPLVLQNVRERSHDPLEHVSSALFKARAVGLWTLRDRLNAAG